MKKDFNNKKKPFEQDKAGYSDEYLQEIHAQLMREQAEPSEQMAPVPLIVMLICGLLLFWGGFYMARYSANFKGDIFNPEWVPGGAEVAKVEFNPMAQGKKLFAKTCQQCHQADGKGLPGVYPPLVGSPWLLNSDVRPIKILLMGLQGPITVEGNKFDGNMPSVGYWKDRDIAAVLTFVRQNWGNTAGPIAEELVAKVRKELGDRKNPWSAQELLKEHPL